MNLQSEAQVPARPMVGLMDEAAKEGGCSPLEFRSVMMGALGAMQVGGAPVWQKAGAEVWEAEGAASGQCESDVAALKAIEEARQEGFREGERQGERAARVAMEAEMRAALAQAREMVARGVREFAEARERYFGDVEQEVVRLALAIAARVLHREAHVDPLLLSGAVRVALEKMADRSGVVVRVAEGEAAEWERVFAGMEPGQRPEIAGDAALSAGECVLDTTMGTVELGVSAQLEEIERGFFDLLNHRPGKAA